MNYYHIELDDHHLILTNNILTESYKENKIIKKNYNKLYGITI